MQQHQPQQEFSQDHIVRRLIAKIRKPSDAGAIGGMRGLGSSHTLQVPQQQIGGLPTISGQLPAAEGGTQSGAGSEGSAAGASSSIFGGATGGSSIARSLAGKQSRWSQLVASAAAGAASSRQAAPKKQPAESRPSAAGAHDSQPADQSSSNRSSADGGRDDEVDENYFRPGGKGHQALLDNMDKR